MDPVAPARQPTSIVAAYRQRRFAWLFVSMLVTLGAGGTLNTLAPKYNPLQVLLGLNLLAAIASVAHEGNMRVPLLSLGIAFVLVRGLLATLGIPGMLELSEALWVIAIVVTMAVALRHALGQGAVDRERIFAALDAYLLAGLLFGVSYYTLDRVWPSSFGGTTPGMLELPRAIYFSFVTIATLGYGDVVPASPPAQGLAIVEGVSGQMYLAVLVARLVSLYARERDV
jgi:hypothetical protein